MHLLLKLLYLDTNLVVAYQANPNARNLEDLYSDDGMPVEF